MVFVSGGTGLVGMHLIASLLSDGQQVVAGKRANSDLSAIRDFLKYSLPNVPGAFESIQWRDVDLEDRASFAIAMKDCNAIYHAAAMVSFHSKDFSRMVEFNVGSTRTMVDYALDHDVTFFGYVSSVAALGREENKPITESTEWKYDENNSTYAGSKYNAELEVWRGIEEGLNAYMVNPSIIMGIGDFTRSSAEIFKQVKKGMPYYPGGNNGFVAVQDVVEVLRHMCEKEAPSRRYMLVAENWSYQHLFDLVANAVNGKSPNKQAPLWTMKLYWRIQQIKELFTGKRAFVTRESLRNANQKYTYDATKVKNELNYQFQDVKEVIKETGEYFLNH
ncbi:MAG: NAD-dependent epimerase/dehydratase family protein [Bacteroidota bacterium]